MLISIKRCVLHRLVQTLEIIYQRSTFMDRQKIQQLIHQGRTSEVAKFFQDRDYGLNPEDFLGEHRKYGQSGAKYIYEIFIGVLGFLSSNNPNERLKNSENLENSKVIKNYLANFIPHEIMEKSNYRNNDEIPKYLDSQKSDTEVLEILWDGLRLIGNDDLTVRVAWAAFSYVGP